MSINIISDSGRTDSGMNERNDCTVRAYAAVKGISYQQAHAILFVYGRKMRRGFRVGEFFNSEFGSPLPRPAMTVENYVNYIAHSGKWIILISKHVFAVIDGKIIDTNPEYNLSRHVKAAWKCE